MQVMILSSHRTVAPFGLNGGNPGSLGRNWIERSNGTKQQMTGTDKADVSPGDKIIIETPGGGGFGKSAERDPASIQKDIDNGYISAAAAEKEYGYKATRD